MAKQKAKTKPEKKAYLCGQCQGKLESTRLPMSWKNHPKSGLWCNSCWHKTWAMRAVTIPVVKPLHCTWAEFQKQLDLCWRSATDLANWGMMEILRHDVRREPGMEKLPPMPKIYLYGLLTGFHGRSAWDGCMASAQCVLQQVEKKYMGKVDSGKSRRWEILWLNSARYATFSYPFPYAIHNANWSVRFTTEDNRFQPVVSVPLPGGRCELRLRNDSDYRRQMECLKKIASGEYLQGELSIHRGKKETAKTSFRGGKKVRERNKKRLGKQDTYNNHPGLVEDGESGGGQHGFYPVLIKVCVWVPRNQHKDAVHTMLVKTDPNALWVVELDGRTWIYNGDIIRNRFAESTVLKNRQERHDAYRQRTSEDTKREKRWPRRQLRQINNQRRRRCDKHNARVNDFIDKATAMLANYAVRQKVQTVVYDDDIKTFFNHFPWRAMKDKLSYKLDDEGISLISREESESSENSTKESA